MQASSTSPMVRWVRRIRALPFTGDARYCPVCESAARRFASFGNPVRRDAQCWYCHSLERHRFACEYLLRTGELLRPGHRVLHIAPETCLEPRLRTLIGAGYLTTDLAKAGVDLHMDITAMSCPDNSFDAVICSHVLEHVSDDRAAMREFLRVLKPGGQALLMVPVLVEKTFEDPAITTPAARLEAYGQEDHVRIYGHDFAQRARESGFDVEVIRASGFLTEEERVRLGVSAEAGDIFLCHNRDAGTSLSGHEPAVAGLPPESGL